MNNNQVNLFGYGNFGTPTQQSQGQQSSIGVNSLLRPTQLQPAQMPNQMPTYPQQNYGQPNIQPQPVQQQVLQFSASQDNNEVLYETILLGVLRHGLTENQEKKLTATKGYICTFRGDGNFGITINLGHDQVYRHLQPFVYNMSQANTTNGGYGDIVDDRFLSSATWLVPQLNSRRDNIGGSTNVNGQTIRNYMNALSSYIDAVYAYITQYIQRDQMGQIIQTPQLQQALMQRFRFGGINVTPGIALENGVPVINFFYSLSETVTLDLKRDITYMVTE